MSKQTQTPKPGNYSKSLREAYRTGWSNLATAWERRNNNTGNNSQTTVTTSSSTDNNLVSSQLRVSNSPPPQEHEISGMERLINMNTFIDAKKQAALSRKRVQTPHVSGVNDKKQVKIIRSAGTRIPQRPEASEDVEVERPNTYSTLMQNTDGEQQAAVRRNFPKRVHPLQESEVNDNKAVNIIRSAGTRIPQRPEANEDVEVERPNTYSTVMQNTDAEQQAAVRRNFPKRVHPLQESEVNDNKAVNIIRSAGTRIPQRPEANEDVEVERPNTYSTVMQNTDAEQQAAVRRNFPKRVLTLQESEFNNYEPIQTTVFAGTRISNRPEVSEDVEMEQPNTCNTLMQNIDAEKQAKQKAIDSWKRARLELATLVNNNHVPKKKMSIQPDLFQISLTDKILVCNKLTQSTNSQKPATSDCWEEAQMQKVSEFKNTLIIEKIPSAGSNICLENEIDRTDEIIILTPFIQTEKRTLALRRRKPRLEQVSQINPSVEVPIANRIPLKEIQNIVHKQAGTSCEKPLQQLNDTPIIEEIPSAVTSICLEEPEIDKTYKMIVLSTFTQAEKRAAALRRCKPRLEQMSQVNPIDEVPMPLEETGTSCTPVPAPVPAPVQQVLQVNNTPIIEEIPSAGTSICLEEDEIGRTDAMIVLSTFTQAEKRAAEKKRTHMQQVDTNPIDKVPSAGIGMKRPRDDNANRERETSIVRTNVAINNDVQNQPRPKRTRLIVEEQGFTEMIVLSTFSLAEKEAAAIRRQ